MADHPAETKVPIPVTGAYTVPAGHQIGVRMHLTFVGTSAHTLFYDSTRYQSGVTFQTGQVITHEDCPTLLGTTRRRRRWTGPRSRPPSRRAPTTRQPGGPTEAVVPALTEAVPAVLDDLPALDEVGQEGLELVPEVGAVEGQLNRRPEEVDLLPDVVAPRLEGIAEDRLRL